MREGVPIPNSFLFTHHFRNNKPSVWLYFKLNDGCLNEKTTCIQKCTNMIPKVVSRSQVNIVKNGFNQMIKMKFAKKSSKVNYMITTVAESLNNTLRMNDNFKDEIRNELVFLSELENQNLLEDSILGNKIIYGGETKFEAFIDKMNTEMSNDYSVHSRRHNEKMYSARWISIRHMKEDIGSLLGPDDKSPCEEWIAAQFTSNNNRILQNERYYGRINVSRKIQKHTIIKDNVDAHYSNACLKSVRKFGINYKENTIFISWDDKNKMKFGAPGEPLAQSHKTR